MEHLEQVLKMSTNEVSWIEFTIFKDYDSLEIPEKNMKIWLRTYADIWKFQLEKCPTSGRLHYQGTIHLIKKQRTNALANVFKSTVLPDNELGWQGSVHFTPTVKENINNIKYSIKFDTRVAGPWSHDDFEMPPRYKKDLWEYQKKIEETFMSEEDCRTIHIIVDEEGCIGKSWIGGRLEVDGIAHKIQQGLNAKEIVGQCYQDWHDPTYAGGKSKGYIIDIPRADEKQSMRPIFSAIEFVKEGILKDWRYGTRPRKICYRQPIIWVFMNQKPNLSLLTKDRWKIYKINTETKDFE